MRTMVVEKLNDFRAGVLGFTIKKECAALDK